MRFFVLIFVDFFSTLSLSYPSTFILDFLCEMAHLI